MIDKSLLKEIIKMKEEDILNLVYDIFKGENIIVGYCQKEKKKKKNNRIFRYIPKWYSQYWNNELYSWHNYYEIYEDMEDIEDIDDEDDNHSNIAYIYILRNQSYPIIQAHIDTVHGDRLLTDMDILENERYMMSIKGIGADDRAGVYACIELGKKMKKINILLTNKEESGSIGMKEFIKQMKNNLKHIPYAIAIDRKGYNEVVFYNDEKDNKDKTFYQICKSLFIENMGTYSDIKILGEELKICTCNISAGYYHQHSLNEYLDIQALNNSIQKIPILISKLGYKKYHLNVIKPVKDIYHYWKNYNKKV